RHGRLSIDTQVRQEQRALQEQPFHIICFLLSAARSQPKRSTANGARSILGAHSSTTSLTRRPVPAPRLNPSIEWPVATTTFRYFFIRPIYGNPSAEQGR